MFGNEKIYMSLLIYVWWSEKISQVFFSFNFQYNWCFYSVNIFLKRKTFKDNVNALPIKLEKVIFFMSTPFLMLNLLFSRKTRNYARIDAIKTRKKVISHLSKTFIFNTWKWWRKETKIVVDNNGPVWTSKTRLANFVHDVAIHKSVTGDHEYLVYKHAYNKNMTTCNHNKKN